MDALFSFGSRTSAITRIDDLYDLVLSSFIFNEKVWATIEAGIVRFVSTNGFSNDGVKHLVKTSPAYFFISVFIYSDLCAWILDPTNLNLFLQHYLWITMNIQWMTMLELKYLCRKPNKQPLQQFSVMQGRFFV